MIEIKIKGLDELMKIADRYPAISEKHVNKAIGLTLSRIKTDVTHSSPTFKGGIKSKWRIDLKRFEGSLSNVTQSTNGYFYASVIEYGSRPFWPDYRKGSSLDIWAQAKGIPTYLVARSISRKGIKAQHYLQKSVDKNSGNTDGYFAEALENIIKEV